MPARGVRGLPTRARRSALHLALISYCMTSVGAFLWTVNVSLKSNQEFFASSPWSLPRDIRLSNYGDAWVNAQMGRYFVNSIYVTVLSVAGGLLISVLAAYVLARVEFPGRGLIRGGILAGLMMPQFLVVIPLYFVLRSLGLLGSLHGLVVVYVATQVPFSVYVLMGFFSSLPRELEEAAYVDGASPSRAFFSVVLPQVGPVAASLVLLNTLTVWNEFFYALVVLNDEANFTLPIGLLGLSVSAVYSANWVQLFAGMVISMIPVLVLFAIAQERIATGIAGGGLKG